MRLIGQLLKLNRACVAVFLARWDEQRPACRMSTDKHGYLTLQSAWVPELCYFVITHTGWVPVRDCLFNGTQDMFLETLRGRKQRGGEAPARMR